MKIGFLGAGNMGGAIVRGYASAAKARGETPDLLVFDTDGTKADALAELQGVRAAGDLRALVDESDILIVALKPNVFDAAIPRIAAYAKQTDPTNARRVFVSIAAGISIAYLQEALGKESKIVRVMPNTPAMVGEGMTALARGEGVSDEEYEAVRRVFRSVGETVSVTEPSLDAVTGISGSSPAYAYMYMQALIECGVENGLCEADATLLAARSALGAARMVLEGDADPVQLRVNVCSPGGTTEEAVRVLEERGFMDTIKEAANAAVAKSKRMTR
ncbi:MAG: pyrroline-5-carboxylate reductase [Clostridiales Family XIII bacterium]|jgi:pyrroline-5-carboxylate reductase|nr:pyrroline-5-carboxylate reductase [Clostridiales Family XIII bacterium]